MMEWLSEQHPWGTGRLLHTSGPLTITSWIDEGPRGGELVRYDLDDCGYHRGSFWSLDAAKRRACRIVEAVGDADTRATLYALGVEVAA